MALYPVPLRQLHLQLFYFSLQSVRRWILPRYCPQFLELIVIIVLMIQLNNVLANASYIRFRPEPDQSVSNIPLFATALKSIFFRMIRMAPIVKGKI
jgi:hypothetical protein